MKYILSIVLFLSIAFAGQSQNTPADSSITLIVPKQALWHFSKFVGNSLTRDNKNIPEQIGVQIGTDTTFPNSLITYTFKRGRLLSNFMVYLESKNIGGWLDFWRQIYLNNPSIPGYTSLKQQLIAMSALNTQQGRTAIAVRKSVNDYEAALAADMAADQLDGIEQMKPSN